MNFTIVYTVLGWKICFLFGSQGGVDLVQQGITVLDQMFNQVDDCKFVEGPFYLHSRKALVTCALFQTPSTFKWFSADLHPKRGIFLLLLGMLLKP
jgi:hypothetical protein